MSTATASKIVSPYSWKGLVIKDINIVERAGKANLTFVDLIDPETYETSGQYMYLPEDRNEILPPKGTKVDVYTKPGMYQNRATISFASIVPAGKF